MSLTEMTDEKIVALLQEVPEARLKRILELVSRPAADRPRPVFGSGKGCVLYMADDFDAPLDDFKEYME